MRQFMKEMDTQLLPSEAEPLARHIGHSAANMCKKLPSRIQNLDWKVPLERKSINRQRGLVHMGFLATMKRFAILREVELPDEPEPVKRGRRSSQYFQDLFLYEGKMYAVQHEP